MATTSAFGTCVKASACRCPMNPAPMIPTFTRSPFAMFVALQVSIYRLTDHCDWRRPVSGRAYHPPSRREGYESRRHILTRRSVPQVVLRPPRADLGKHVLAGPQGAQ